MKKQIISILIIGLFFPLLALADLIPPGPSPWYLDFMSRNTYNFLTFLSSTLIIEILFSILFFVFTPYASRLIRIVTSVFLANIISYSLFWFLLKSIIPYGFYFGMGNESIILFKIILLEIIIVIFEAFFIYWFNKKEVRSLYCTIYSSLANFITAILGLFISYGLFH